MNMIQSLKILFLLLVLTSCSTTPKASYQLDDGEKFLIQLEELPASWQLRTSWGGPLSKEATDWRNLFVQSEYFDRQIVSSATILKEETGASQLWKQEYLPMKTSSSTSPCLTSLEQSARSKLADEVEFLCYDTNNSLKQIGAYEYFVMARYGNVISTFGAVVVEGNDLTTEQATQMGVLRQADMEALLKLLDEKFERANSN